MFAKIISNIVTVALLESDWEILLPTTAAARTSGTDLGYLNTDSLKQVKMKMHAKQQSLK